MAQLSSKVKAYAAANGVVEVDFLKDVLLQDDGQGPYIKEWNLAIAKPTDAQLADAEAAAYCGSKCSSSSCEKSCIWFN
jgi:hypothetical protein